MAFGLSWSVEKVGTVVGLIAVGVTLVMAWASHTADFESLKEDVKKIDDAAANRICTEIVSRQLLALEKNNSDLSDRLGGMSVRYGCIKDYGTMLATSEPIEAGATVLTPSQQANALRDLSEIDESVDWSNIMDAIESLERQDGSINELNTHVHQQ